MRSIPVMLPGNPLSAIGASTQHHLPHAQASAAQWGWGWQQLRRSYSRSAVPHMPCLLPPAPSRASATRQQASHRRCSSAAVLPHALATPPYPACQQGRRGRLAVDHRGRPPRTLLGPPPPDTLLDTAPERPKRLPAPSRQQLATHPPTFWSQLPPVCSILSSAGPTATCRALPASRKLRLAWTCSRQSTALLPAWSASGEHGITQPSQLQRTVAGEQRGTLIVAFPTFCSLALPRQAGRLRTPLSLPVPRLPDITATLSAAGSLTQWWQVRNAQVQSCRRRLPVLRRACQATGLLQPASLPCLLKCRRWGGPITYIGPPDRRLQPMAGCKHGFLLHRQWDGASLAAHQLAALH